MLRSKTAITAMPPAWSGDALRRLMNRDPDPRVRRRAHAVLLVAEGTPLLQVARLFHTAPHRIRAWRARFRAHGRGGLADAPRRGRPSKLSPAIRALLEEALARSPQDDGCLSTVWSVRALGAFLAQQHGLQVCGATVHRALLALGYRYRRPRHDLQHRQAPQAVAAARQVLDWLQKSAPQVLEGFDWSTWMNVKSTSTPAWPRGGRHAARHGECRRPAWIARSWSSAPSITRRGG